MDDPLADHMATNDRHYYYYYYYYYGNTGTFNSQNIPGDIRDLLVQAWNDSSRCDERRVFDATRLLGR